MLENNTINSDNNKQRESSYNSSKSSDNSVGESVNSSKSHLMRDSSIIGSVSSNNSLYTDNDNSLSNTSVVTSNFEHIKDFDINKIKKRKARKKQNTLQSLVHSIESEKELGKVYNYEQIYTNLPSLVLCIIIYTFLVFAFL